jgi:flagellar assembly protein FliH
MNTSPDRTGTDAVLRGAGAAGVSAARFDADLTAAASPISTRKGEAAWTAARTAGYAEGWAQGQRAARVASQAAQDQIAAARQAEDAEREARVRRAVGALVHAADDLGARSATAAEATEDLVLRTAVDLAEALLGHELSAGAARDTNALRRAMAATPAVGPVTVRLHPDDYRTLTELQDSSGRVDGRQVTLAPDGALRPGDAVAESGTTTVDATLSGALTRMRQVLGL